MNLNTVHTGSVPVKKELPQIQVVLLHVQKNYVQSNF